MISIRRLQAASGDVIVVATVKTFKPAADIQDLREQDVREPRQGHRTEGQGQRLLLVLLAVDDRDVWAEVGYDLEGIITDGFAGRDQPRDDGAVLPTGRLRRRAASPAPRDFAQRIAQARNVTLDGVPQVDAGRRLVERR